MPQAAATRPRSRAHACTAVVRVRSSHPRCRNVRHAREPIADTAHGPHTGSTPVSRPWSTRPFRERRPPDRSANTAPAASMTVRPRRVHPPIVRAQRPLHHHPRHPTCPLFTHRPDRSQPHDLTDTRRLHSGAAPFVKSHACQCPVCPCTETSNTVGLREETRQVSTLSQESLTLCTRLEWLSESSSRPRHGRRSVNDRKAKA